MAKKLLIANWKSHKTALEASDFFNVLKDSQVNFEDKEVVICPSFTTLSTCFNEINTLHLPVSLGAQTISSHDEGAFTGEISARQIKEFATYVIIGHSERRMYQNESDKEISLKIKKAKEVGLIVILCIQDENSFIDETADIVAYEPPSAIGTGNAAEPLRVQGVFKKLIDKTSARLLYGGSITSSDIQSYSSVKGLEGFLVGGASLNPHEFLALISLW